jgi:hypothetical protein
MEPVATPVTQAQGEIEKEEAPVQDPRNPRGILNILRDFFETKDEEA